MCDKCQALGEPGLMSALNEGVELTLSSADRDLRLKIVEAGTEPVVEVVDDSLSHTIGQYWQLLGVFLRNTDPVWLPGHLGVGPPGARVVAVYVTLPNLIAFNMTFVVVEVHSSA